ncbi:hypothetical protein BH10ACT9_BH10ACT9_57400 [soil metagenome]
MQPNQVPQIDIPVDIPIDSRFQRCIRTIADREGCHDRPKVMAKTMKAALPDCFGGNSSSTAIWLSGSENIRPKFHPLPPKCLAGRQQKQIVPGATAAAIKPESMISESPATTCVPSARHSARVWSRGMTKHVTRVVLSRADATLRQSIISTSCRELFRVSWTLSESGEASQKFAQSHYSLSAAQAHVINLLKRIPRGVSIADVYAEQLDETALMPLSRLTDRCVCGHPTHPSRFCLCGCSISEIDNGRDASAPQSAVSN